MNANRSFLKSLVISLSLIISLVVISKAQATYIFEWRDSGQEWYNSPDYNDLITVKADKWQGFFTLPDSAVTYGSHYGDYQSVSLDLNQYLDFSLTGKLISGNYMEATAFHGGFQFETYQSKNSKDIIIDTRAGSNISFIMANPSWIDTPLYLTIDSDEHWFIYNDMVFDADTNSMVSANISHDGAFVGHYIPVPEPVTMLLFGTGIAGLVGIRFRKKKK